MSGKGIIDAMAIFAKAGQARAASEEQSKRDYEIQAEFEDWRIFSEQLKMNIVALKASEGILTVQNSELREENRKLRQQNCELEKRMFKLETDINSNDLLPYVHLLTRELSATKERLLRQSIDTAAAQALHDQLFDELNRLTEGKSPVFDIATRKQAIKEGIDAFERAGQLGFIFKGKLTP